MADAVAIVCGFFLEIFCFLDMESTTCTRMLLVART